MSEVLERVAAAIAGADSVDGPAYAVLARAAIEAMREPTPEMLSAYRGALSAAISETPGDMLGRAKGRAGGYRVKTEAKAIARWKAMIDAALDNPEFPGSQQKWP